MPEIKCVNCGEIFIISNGEARSRERKYCSQKCYQANRGKGFIEIRCAYCKKKKIVRKIYVDRGQYKYCSNSCRRKGELKGYTKDELKRTCIECGKVFYAKPSKPRRKHCSIKCRKKRKSQVCENCGKVFEPKSARKTRYCSLACYKSSRNETSIEKKVREFLEDNNIVFESQVQFKRYVVDFLLPRIKTIIECDGEYWHNKDDNVKNRDKEKDRYLEEIGFEVVRLKEKDIKNGSFEEQLCLH